MLSFRFFSALLFLSAFLLFFIQPLVSRIILPVLGGGSSVWTTSMLFFQMLLLLGYVWAHIMIRYMPIWLPPIIQAVTSLCALFSINYLIPLDINYETIDPIWWQIKTLFIMVGIPYFALATNAPLYQAIYKNFKNTQRADQKTPYALYSLSNVGSFCALLSYPFVIEPLFSLQAQTSLWFWGYVALCALIGLSGVLCVIQTVKNKNQASKTTSNKTTETHEDKPVFKTILLWSLLAFIPSSLMLGVTSHITTDVAAIPLLWIIPLAFYISSFVMAFSDPPSGLAQNEKMLTVITVILIALTLCFSVFRIHTALFEVPLHYITFLCIACLCHLKLSQHKPSPNHLTFFFFIVSLGGFLGGIFNAVIAYQLFIIPIEYFVVMGVACCTIAALAIKKSKPAIPNIIWIVAIVALSGALIFIDETIYRLYCMALFLMIMIWNINQGKVFLFASLAIISIYIHARYEINGEYVDLSRNTYGTLAVQDNENIRRLKHGTTLHGVQKLPLTDNPEPLSYYHKQSPLGDVFKQLDSRRSTPQNIAVLGLGVGSVACYKKPGRDYHFFEINPDVVDIAKNPNLFTYLSSCQPDAPITLGDARINLKKQQDNGYDLILVDTFTSDAIPIHLLTKEAIVLYNQKIKNNGLIAFHISNRYFELRPILAALAKNEGMLAIYRDGRLDDGLEETHFATMYVVFSSNATIIEALKRSNDGWRKFDEKQNLPKLWTDDYVNIFSAISSFDQTDEKIDKASTSSP